MVCVTREMCLGMRRDADTRTRQYAGNWAIGRGTSGQEHLGKDDEDFQSLPPPNSVKARPQGQ